MIAITKGDAKLIATMLDDLEAWTPAWRMADLDAVVAMRLLLEELVAKEDNCVRR